MRLLLALVICTAVGCSSANRSQIYGHISGKNCAVKVYSGGQLVGEYESYGKVFGEDATDGWYFTDSKTGRLVRVSGTIIIEQEQ